MIYDCQGKLQQIFRVFKDAWLLYNDCGIMNDLEW